MCMRGFDFIAAITFVAEIGDLTRVAKPTALMTYLGLEEAITAQFERPLPKDAGIIRRGIPLP